MAKRGPLKGKDTAPDKERGRRHTVLDERRRIIVDALPLEPPIGYKRAPTISEQIKNMVRGEHLAEAARKSGNETFEEADDFDIEEEFDPRSPYEADFDPPPATWEDQSTALGEHLARGMRNYEEKMRKEAEAQKKKEAAKEPPPEDKKKKEPDQPI